MAVEVHRLLGAAGPLQWPLCLKGTDRPRVGPANGRRPRRFRGKANLTRPRVPPTSRARSSSGLPTVADEGVMPPRVKVGELFDTVRHVGHQLPETDPRGNADPAPQLTCDGG